MIRDDDSPLTEMREKKKMIGKCSAQQGSVVADVIAAEAALCFVILTSV